MMWLVVSRTSRLYRHEDCVWACPRVSLWKIFGYCLSKPSMRMCEDDVTHLEGAQLVCDGWWLGLFCTRSELQAIALLKGVNLFSGGDMDVTRNPEGEWRIRDHLQVPVCARCIFARIWPVRRR